MKYESLTDVAALELLSLELAQRYDAVAKRVDGDYSVFLPRLMKKIPGDIRDLKDMFEIGDRRYYISFVLDNMVEAERIIARYEAKVSK